MPDDDDSQVAFYQPRHALPIVRYMLQSVEAPALVTYRDGGDGWTVVEVVGHLLDCERLFVERAQLTVTQDCPDCRSPIKRKM